MKSRTIILLWTIAILLGLSIFLLKKSRSDGQHSATARISGETLLHDFPVKEVTNIEITGAKNSVTLLQKDGKWAVEQRDDYPANTRNIHDFLRTLSTLKVTQGIEAGPSFASSFGMDENSQEPDEHGITATFKNAESEEIAKISFGKNLESAASQSPFGGGATGRYVRNHADDSGFYAVSEVFGSLSADPKSWLKDDFLKVEKIESIAVTQPGTDKNEWTLVRADEDAEFEFDEAFPGVKIDNSATAPFKSLFSFARFDDVVPAAQVAEKSTPEKLQKVQIKTFEGFQYDLTLQPVKTSTEASPGTENYLMTVAVSADLPKERKKPENEEPEDSAEADEAFSERLQTLTERLEATKAIENRTFEVSRFTVDSLLKGRTDLMLKTPAGADAPTPAPGPTTGGSAFTPPVEIPARPAPQEPAAEEE